MASSIVENAINGHKEIVRPVANFSPSLWGTQFLDYHFDTKAAENISEAIKGLKDDVQNKLASGASKMDTMNLIDILERLGISYHFDNEIEEKLGQLFNQTTDYEDESYDLYTVAVHFRVFRQHGHRISCDVFRKFMDGNGKFDEAHKTDAKGLLSLYQAAHLRVHEEDILEEALTFATANLKSLAPNLEPCLREQVMHALVQPMHLNIQRLEARNFICIYDDDESLSKFAKLDFNLVQMLHKKELQEVSRWWKELDLAPKLPYIRNRLVEAFFWAVGLYFEPQYSRARLILTKLFAMISVTDDTYDAYGTIEELDILTTAIDRWHIREIAHLPEYIRPFYKALLELYEQFEEELAKEGRSYAVTYAIEGLQNMVRSYNAEAKWLLGKYLPPFDEYMRHALITSGVGYLVKAALMESKSVTREHFEWLCTNPKMLQAGEMISRAIDDPASYEVEMERGSSIGVQCYVKENGVATKEAMKRLWEMATNAWKDTNEEGLKPYSSTSKEVHMRILNFDRVIEVMYKNNEDGYSHPVRVLKPHIIMLFVNAIKID